MADNKYQPKTLVAEKPAHLKSVALDNPSPNAKTPNSQASSDSKDFSRNDSFPEVQNPSGQFRRKYPRRNFTKSVGILINGHYTVGRGVEIGEGGLSLWLPKDFDVQKEIVLSFQIPEGGFVSVRSEIKTCRKDSGGFVHGCFFKNLLFDRKREIRFFVSASGQ